MDIYKNYGFYGKTQIICAAIRTPKQIVDCAVAGADIVTTGLAVYQDAIKHAYTRQGQHRDGVSPGPRECGEIKEKRL